MNTRHASTAAILATLAGTALSGRALAQSTDPFSAQFQLSSLLPSNGGSGTNGFVLNGIDPSDKSGYSVSSAGDMNGDGFLDNGDIGTFVTFFLTGDFTADMNGDGFLDNGDIGAFVAAFLAGC